MTAMSDVTVLLLTFFMLTSTFLAKEPFQANTPPSVSTDEMPMSNVVEILVSSNAKMREELLMNMQSEFEAQKGKKVEFTKQQVEAFTKLGSFGVPFELMPAFLSASPEEQDAWLTGKEEAKGKKTGIPVEELSEERKEKIRRSNNGSGCTEFQMWINAVAKTSNEALKQHIAEGTGFSLKADLSTPYKTVHMIMDNMQTIGKNKFILVTALKTEE